MPDRRRALRAERPPTWPEIFEEIDAVAEKTKEEVKEEVSAICDNRFIEMTTRVELASVAQLAAIESLKALLIEFKDSIAVTAEIEGAAKKGFGFLKACWELLKATGRGIRSFWISLKGVAPVFALAALLYYTAAGKITVHDIWLYVTKIKD
jgi:hypothetical protein